MTAALIACLGASIGVIALLGATLAYSIKTGRSSVERGDRLSDDLHADRLMNVELNSRVKELERFHDESRNAITHLTTRVKAEIKARKKAEDHASAAINELAASGNAPAAAERLRSDLERLRAMANVSEVSDPT